MPDLIKRPDFLVNGHHRSVGGGLADGAAVTNAVAVTRIVACAGATSMTVRFKCTASGTLAVRFVRPDGTTEYAVGNPADTPYTAPNEVTPVTATLTGVAYVAVRFTPSGNGTVNFCDVSFAP